VPGLGARLGRGGATENDLTHADCIIIMGSNMAENHPVAFRYVMKAREQGAKVLHIDPRFSRTSALADRFVRIRPGSDIVFLGGLINYVIEHETYFKEYVAAYTNACTLINPEFKDTEELGGIFSGFNAEGNSYSNATWQYQGQKEPPSPNMHTQFSSMSYSQRVGNLAGQWPPPSDPTMQNPHCVFQIVKRHFARYTPEMVEEMCGVPREEFLQVARTLSENSGRERTTTFCYAVGWTQHTKGPQIIGACALLQLLMGNMGRPGGGILALRGHASIQGSTDIPTLFDILPGYLAMPNTYDRHDTLAGYLETETPKTGFWHNLPTYMISLLKAYYGENATADNDYCYDLLPKISADYSVFPMFMSARQGYLRGMFIMGQNPAVGGMDTSMMREALGKLDWLVVRDLFEIETATFWRDSPEVRTGKLKPADIKTEVFLMPAAIVAEKDGTFTNTQRLIQWHDRTVEPPGDATTEPWFVYHLGRRLRELYAGEDTPQARQLLALDWDYPLERSERGLLEPVVDAILREINGYTVADRKQLPGFAACKDDGSTACGCWIYSGVYPEEGKNMARSRVSDDQYSLGWGFAWPANRRVLYNRASADPQGRPWSERKKLIWWDAEQGKWTGYDVPDFPINKAPDTPAKPDGTGMDALSGADPFIMTGDGKGWLFVPAGLRDGPLPTHYEPLESPVQNALYDQNSNPTAKYWPHKDNQLAALRDPRYPYAVTTYRLTEHHTAGGMSRWVPWLAELQPTFFAEISPRLAGEVGVNNGDWVLITTPRGEIEARALVTERMQPLRVRGKMVETVGLPYHWGYAGIIKGSAANDLVSLVADPNCTIEEAKAFTCNLRKGRLPTRWGGVDRGRTGNGRSKE
jgi:formate dehydrogenase major subunit